MRNKTKLLLSVFALALIAAAMLIVSDALNDTAPVAANVLEVSDGEGMVFDGKSLYHTSDPVEEEIYTYEAWVKAPEGYNKEQGVIYGNYEGLEKNGVRFRGFTYGRTYLYMNTIDNGTTCHFYFSGTNISNGEWTHVAIVDDTVAGEARCYINGDLAATVKMSAAQKAASRKYNNRPMCLGGDFAVSTNPFYGSIRSVAVYSDVRTADEIKQSMNCIDLNDPNLISAYNLNGAEGSNVIKDATGKYDMTNNRATSGWVEPEQVPAPDDYAYSMAIVGDTQIISGYYPELYHTYFDWLLANKDEQKIAHVLNLGDMTNFNYDWEWDNIREEWFRLNGKLDYTLVRGDHDILSDKLSNNGDDTTKYDRWFDVPEYTDRFANDAGVYRGENGSITNSYRALNIKGNKYLIVTMDKYPSEEVLAWLDAAIKSYPDHRIIMTMHCFIDNDGSYLPAESKGPIGIDVWNRIKEYENLEMVICGHQYAWGVTWLKAKGTNGNIVNQICVNPQGPDFDQAGPTGMIAMLYFSADGKQVQVRYYSPILDKYYVGNENGIINGYDIDTSLFTMRTDDMNVATPVSTISGYNEAVTENTQIYVSETLNGNDAYAAVSFYTDNKITNGKIAINYDSSLLSNPVVNWEGNTFANKSVQTYEGRIIVTFDGFVQNGEGGNIFGIGFDSAITDTTPTAVTLDVLSLGYIDDGNNYYYANEDILINGAVLHTTSEVVVTYNDGDSFEEKLEYALELANYGDVKFVMNAGFTATASVVVGSESNIPEGVVTVCSGSTLVELSTGGHNLIFWGNMVFDNLKVSGNGATTKNTLFFPDGTSAIFGTAISVGSSRANVAGTNLELNSGVWYVVSAITDYSVVEGYFDQRHVDSGLDISPYRAIYLNDPKITLQGTARTYDLFGGVFTQDGDSHSKDGLIFVLGTSDVKILGGASVERWATASGNADYSTHDGDLYINTTGTVVRPTAAVGPVGRGESNHSYTPNFTLTIDGGTISGVTSVWVTGKNTKTYANTTVTINKATVTGRVYLGLYSDVASAKNYGTNTVYINDGTYSSNIYGGLLNGSGCQQYADVTVVIKGGTFSKDVYFGAWVNKTDCVQGGTADVTIEGGQFNTPVYAGSYFRYDGSTAADKATNSNHSANTKFTVKGGNFTANLWGGSMFGGTGAKHTGNTEIVITGGTFGTATKFYGQSCMYGNSTLHSGDTTIDIYGGVAFNADVYGGGLMQTAGKNYSDTKTMSGDITFNIHNTDINGNSATAPTFAGSLHAGAYMNAYWGIVSGNITYHFKGIKLPGTSAGGCDIVAGKGKMSGTIHGTLENCSFNGNFYGASRLRAEYSNQQGASTLVLINTNVFSVVSAGAYMGHKSSESNGNSTFEFRSGYASANGRAVGGCYFIVPNVKVKGNSKLIFGTNSTSPYVNAEGKLVGGSYAGTAAFTTAGATTEWGMYGSSELVINGGEVKTGAYAIGGSYISTTSTPVSSVDWANYPLVGGAAGANNTNTIKLTINGGTVNGPRLYAGSFLEDGGQDHGTVELAVNGGTVVLDSTGITNYGSTATKSLYPATFYSSASKNVNCNYVLTLNGGTYKIASGIGYSVGLSDYTGTFMGNTTLNLNVDTQSTKVFPTSRPGHASAGLNNLGGVMIGDSTLNLGNGGVWNSNGPATAGCCAVSTGRTDVADDGIQYGFRHIGNVYLNMTGGKIARLTLTSGYRSNVDGNVYINISGGTVAADIYGGTGRPESSLYSSVSGDIIWNIRGGTFTAGVYGGSNANAANEGYSEVGGNVYMEISGGAFSGNLSVGAMKGVWTNNKGYIKVVGNNATFANGIFAEGNTDSGDSAYSKASASNYVLDLWHYTGDANALTAKAYGFGTTFYPFNDGSSITVGGSTKVEYVVGQDIAATLLSDTITVDGETYNYADVVAFDSYTTEYKNAFTFVDADEEGNAIGAIDKVTPYATHKVIFKVGTKASAPALLNHVFKVSNKSVSLASNLIMNYKVLETLESAYGYKITHATVSFAGETDTLYPVLDNGKYVFKFENIAPQGISDEMIVTVYGTYGEGENAVEVQSQPLSYGVKDYCYEGLNVFTDSETLTLIVDLLNYGSAAQEYAEYNLDNLVNKDLTASQQALATPDSALEGLVDSKDVDYETIENATATIAPSLTLGNAIMVRYRVTLPAGAGLANIKLVVVNASDADRTWSFTSSAFVSTGKSNEYYVYLPYLNADQVSDVLYATVYDGEVAISNTCRYTVESYVAAAQALTDSKFAKLKTLTAAMMKYGIAAANYGA